MSRHGLAAPVCGCVCVCVRPRAPYCRDPGALCGCTRVRVVQTRMPATALCTAPAYWNGAADGETVHAREGVPVNGHVATPPTLPYRQAWTIGQVRGRRRRSTAGCALRDGPYRQVHAAACRRGGGPSHAARLGQQCQGQCPPPLSACSGRIRHAPTIGRCSARTCSTPRARARCQGGMATDFPRGWSGSAAFLTTLTGTSKQGRTATAPSTHPVAIPRAAARRRAPASSTLLCKQTVKRKQTDNQTNKTTHSSRSLRGRLVTLALLLPPGTHRCELRLPVHAT